MKLITERLILRPWRETDAHSLFEYAKDPAVGPITGWMPHKNVEESLKVIKDILVGKECYAICLREDDVAIGSIELKFYPRTDMTSKDDECELGYWIGKPFWNRGLVTEAAFELLRHAFEDLKISTVWCGYYEGNMRSKRVQEKLGFVFHHTCNEVPVPLLGEIRTEHINYMTRERWFKMREET